MYESPTKVLKDLKIHIEREKHDAEIRAKAIDEFAEKCFEEIFKSGYPLDALDITVIAEQLKGGAE